MRIKTADSSGMLRIFEIDQISADDILDGVIKNDPQIANDIDFLPTKVLIFYAKERDYVFIENSVTKQTSTIQFKIYTTGDGYVQLFNYIAKNGYLDLDNLPYDSTYVTEYYI